MQLDLREPRYDNPYREGSDRGGVVVIMKLHQTFSSRCVVSGSLFARLVKTRLCSESWGSLMFVLSQFGDRAGACGSHRGYELAEGLFFEQC